MNHHPLHEAASCRARFDRAEAAVRHGNDQASRHGRAADISGGAPTRAQRDGIMAKLRRIRDDAAALSDYAAQEPLWLCVIALVLPAITLGILATLSALLPPVLP